MRFSADHVWRKRFRRPAGIVLHIPQSSPQGRRRCAYTGRSRHSQYPARCNPECRFWFGLPAVWLLSAHSILMYPGKCGIFRILALSSYFTPLNENRFIIQAGVNSMSSDFRKSFEKDLYLYQIIVANAAKEAYNIFQIRQKGGEKHETIRSPDRPGIISRQ